MINDFITALLHDQEPTPEAWEGVTKGLTELLKEHFAKNHWALPAWNDADGTEAEEMTVERYVADGLIVVADWAKKNLRTVQPADYARLMRNRFLAYLTKAYAAEVKRLRNRGVLVGEPRERHFQGSPTEAPAVTAAWQRFQALLRRYPTPIYAWLERQSDPRLRLAYKALSQDLHEGLLSADQIMLRLFSILEGEAIKFPSREDLCLAWFQVLLPLTERMPKEIKFNRADLAGLFDLAIGDIGVVPMISKDKRYNDDEVVEAPVADEILGHFRARPLIDRTELERKFRILLSKKS